MGLRGVGRAFSDRSFLKILIFSTDNGRFLAIGLSPIPARHNPIPYGLFEGFFVLTHKNEDDR